MTIHHPDKTDDDVQEQNQDPALVEPDTDTDDTEDDVSIASTPTTASASTRASVDVQRASEEHAVGNSQLLLHLVPPDLRPLMQQLEEQFPQYKRRHKTLNPEALERQLNKLGLDMSRTTTKKGKDRISHDIEDKLWCQDEKNNRATAAAEQALQHYQLIAALGRVADRWLCTVWTVLGKMNMELDSKFVMALLTWRAYNGERYRSGGLAKLQKYDVKSVLNSTLFESV